MPKELKFCPRYPLVAWSRGMKGGKPLTQLKNGKKVPLRGKKRVLFTRLRCGMWSCEYCALKNQAIWRAFLYQKLPEVSDDWWFVTLTAHSRMRTEHASYKNLQRGIDVVVKRIRRVFGDIEYVRVYEKHPSSDALHAHLLISNLSPYVVPGCHKNLQPGYIAITERDSHKGVWSIRTWLKKTAQASQIGYQADVQRIADSYAVNYATKYLTKASQDIQIKGLRHVQTTRGIGSPQSKSDREWTVGSFATARDFKAGEIVLDLNTGEEIPPAFWDDYTVYPPENS